MTPRVLAVALLALSCGAERAPGLVQARLPAGTAASVGGEGIAVATVQRIADAQSVPASVARERAISDALFGLEARRLFGDAGYARVAERAAHARALLSRLKSDAAAQGPATDEEVQALTAERWQDFDRPETVRVAHAVVRVVTPEQDAPARALAEQVRAAVAGVKDPDDFVKRAEAVAHGALELRAERLPAMTVDGRGYFPDGPPESGSVSFDPEFAKAAFALPAGATSELVKTQFGYHVILCEARIAEQRVPLEARRRILQDEILKQRAERAKDALLAELNRATPLQLARAADDLTARVKVTE